MDEELTVDLIIRKYPELASQLNWEDYDFNGSAEGDSDDDEFDEYLDNGKIYEVELFNIPGTDLYLVPTMWADSGGDSSSDIIATQNLKEVCSYETDQACNMSAKVSVYQKITNGLAVVAVSGSNGDEPLSLTLYVSK